MRHRIILIAATTCAWLWLFAAAAPIVRAGTANQTSASVSIKNLEFSPATITIKAGQTVTWTNNDDRDHAVVADDGSFKSGNISAGKTYQHTFTKKGTYAYGCTYHPRMRGKVVVQ